MSYRLKGDMTFKRHSRVQMWKKMYNKLHYGVADRPLNFNKVLFIYAGDLEGNHVLS